MEELTKKEKNILNYFQKRNLPWVEYSLKEGNAIWKCNADICLELAGCRMPGVEDSENCISYSSREEITIFFRTHIDILQQLPDATKLVVIKSFMGG